MTNPFLPSAKTIHNPLWTPKNGKTVRRWFLRKDKLVLVEFNTSTPNSKGKVLQKTKILPSTLKRINHIFRKDSQRGQRRVPKVSKAIPIK